MDFSKMTRKEKENLLKKAKDAYYNTGKEIMSDAEFDELEQELDLENSNYVGSTAGKYTIKHSFIMGSLAKTQLKDLGESKGGINWQECLNKINAAMRHTQVHGCIETSPKLDGCSFSLELEPGKEGMADIISNSTRGDGEYGTDIMKWFEPHLTDPCWDKLDEAVSAICGEDETLVIRGEILVRFDDFNEKYVQDYVNPRAFVAGTIGLKYDDASADKIANGTDLHFVCYDYRIFNKKTHKYEELSWMNPKDPTYDILEPYLGHIGELPDKEFCRVYDIDGELTMDQLVEIYHDYDDYRKNVCPYALDGIVFKPMASDRKYNMKERPDDCIALKFLPMLNATVINDISWSVGKTGEYFPTAILEDIKMDDGKTITRASLHNYNWIIDKNCAIGSKVRISLAGDIIPFVYEIVEPVDVIADGRDNNINLPLDGHVDVDKKSGTMHYMKDFSEDELIRNKFMSSADTLGINQIGPSSAEMLYDELSDAVDYELNNIIYLMNEESYRLIYNVLGKSKSVQNIVDNLEAFAERITLKDIINSFNFKMCGERASELCAKMLSDIPCSTSGFPLEAYGWALDGNSRECYLVKDAMERLGVDYLDKGDFKDDASKTPIIMTGSPEACTQYTTKSKWLQAHPQYIETSSWKECKILFTDDLASNTTKMQKAKKLGIEIRQYDDGKSGKPAKVRNETRNTAFDDDDALF